MCISEGVFDVEELRALLGDDHDALAEIVGSFLTATEELLPELDAYCAAGEAGSLLFYVHRLKGSAGTVRATALHLALDAFEEELRAGREVDVAGRLKVVRALFKEFAEAAELLCQPKPPQGEERQAPSPRGDF